MEKNVGKRFTHTVTGDVPWYNIFKVKMLKRHLAVSLKLKRAYQQLHFYPLERLGQAHTEKLKTACMSNGKGVVTKMITHPITV